MEKWYRTICGYIYDPLEGDPENDIPPGKDFLQLPDTWCCFFLMAINHTLKRFKRYPGAWLVDIIQ